MSHIRKRGAGNYYKTVQAYAEDWRQMFANARQYNTETSWVYKDAVELSKVFEAVFERETAGTDLPGMVGNSNGNGNGNGGGPSYQQWSIAQVPQPQQQLVYQNSQPGRKQPTARRKVADPDWSDGDYGSD